VAGPVVYDEDFDSGAVDILGLKRFQAALEHGRSVVSRDDRRQQHVGRDYRRVGDRAVHTLAGVDTGALTERWQPIPSALDSEPETRILAVGNMYPPQHAGGYELKWQQAMRRAQELGHMVRILTSDYIEDRSRAEQDPDVHRTLRWYWDLERYEFPRLSFRQRFELERHNAAELRRHLEEFRPHVLAWWSMGCMSLGMIEQVRRRGVPAVFVVHDEWLSYGPEHDQWIRTWTGRRRGVLGRVVEPLCRLPTRVDLRQAGRWVFNSQYTLERARVAGLQAHDVTIVHPGIDERFLEPLENRPWQWRLLYVGRLDRQKGVDTAVAALAELPSAARLDIWGTGDARYISEMKALARRLDVGERVRFRGFADASRLPAVYADADVVVFPVRWNEPFGLVPLEAMGLGRPVVTTARGGTAEFVRDGVNALVFQADDPRALARCVRRLGEDSQLRERLLVAGRKTAARFPASRFAQATVEEILRTARRAERGRERGEAVLNSGTWPDHGHA
jgi:glycogen(starch) synthase